jgi:hypothetical protein
MERPSPFGYSDKQALTEFQRTFGEVPNVPRPIRVEQFAAATALPVKDAPHESAAARAAYNDLINSLRAVNGRLTICNALRSSNQRLLQNYIGDQGNLAAERSWTQFRMDLADNYTKAVADFRKGLPELRRPRRRESSSRRSSFTQLPYGGTIPRRRNSDAASFVSRVATPVPGASSNTPTNKLHKPSTVKLT